MPIVVPYTTLEPETEEVGKRWNARFVEMLDLTHYYRLVSEYWAQGAGLFIIEHDLVFTDEQIHELLDCPEDWCGFAIMYPPFGKYYGGMQKFSAALMQKTPNLMHSAYRSNDSAHTPGHYCTLDAVLQSELTREGVSMHQHDGLITHLKRYNRQECPHKVAIWQENGFLE